MRLGRDRALPLAALLLAVIVRLALWVPRISSPLHDPDNYLPLARSVSEGRGFEIHGRPSAYRPPLYPLVLVPVVQLPDRLQPWGVAALHAALGAGTVWLTWRTARLWELGATRSAVAAFLVALDPVLAAESRSVMTETLAAFLLVGSLHALAKPGWKAAARSGVWSGLAGLCRPSTLACVSLVALASLVFGPSAWKDRLARSFALTASTFLVLLPWAVRNTSALGEPVWTTTHGGYTLALANNPEYYRDVLRGPPGSVWSGPGQRAWAQRINQTYRGLDEPAADRKIRQEAVRFIFDHPRDFARASLARLKRFWGLAPAGSVYPWPLRLATLAWTLPFWTAVLLGLTTPRLRAWPGVGAVSQVLALSLVHSVFWTDLRMRAPVVPALALMAVHAAWPWRRLACSEKK